MINKTEFVVLKELVESVQRNLDLHIQDTDKEIGDLQDLRIEVSTLKAQIEELR